MPSFKANQLNIYNKDEHSSHFKIEAAPSGATNQIKAFGAGAFDQFNMDLKFKLKASGNDGVGGGDYSNPIEDTYQEIMQNKSDAVYRMEGNGSVTFVGVQSGSTAGSNSDAISDIKADVEGVGEKANRKQNMEDIMAALKRLKARTLGDGSETARSDVDNLNSHIDQMEAFVKAKNSNALFGSTDNLPTALCIRSFKIQNDRSWTAMVNLDTHHDNIGTLLGYTVDQGNLLTINKNAFSEAIDVTVAPSSANAANSIYTSTDILKQIEEQQLRLSHTVASLDSDNSEARRNLSQTVYDRREKLEDAVRANHTANIAKDNELNAKIDSLISNTDPTALDSLAEMVSVFNSADGNLVNHIGTIQVKVDEIVSVLNELLNQNGSGAFTIDSLNAIATDTSQTIADSSALADPSVSQTQSHIDTTTAATDQTNADAAISAAVSQANQPLQS